MSAASASYRGRRSARAFAACSRTRPASFASGALWIFARSAREAGVEVGERRRLLADLLEGRRLAAVGEQACGRAQRDVAVAGPVGARGHREQQVARACPLVLLLDRPAVEPRAAEDPAVVDRHEVLLDEELAQRVREVLLRDGGLGVDAGEQVGDEVALAAERLRPLAPLAVLVPAAALGAGGRPSAGAPRRPCRTSGSARTGRARPSSSGRSRPRTSRCRRRGRGGEARPATASRSRAIHRDIVRSPSIANELAQGPTVPARPEVRPAS